MNPSLKVTWSHGQLIIRPELYCVFMTKIDIIIDNRETPQMLISHYAAPASPPANCHFLHHPFSVAVSFWVSGVMLPSNCRLQTLEDHSLLKVCILILQEIPCVYNGPPNAKSYSKKMITNQRNVLFPFDIRSQCRLQLSPAETGKSYVSQCHL